MKHTSRYFGIGLSIITLAVLAYRLFVSGTGIGGEALGIIAIIFAAKQFFDSSAQLDTITDVARQLPTQLATLKNVAATIDDVSQQISTQALAPFPKNLRDLEIFVSERHEDEHLKIMVDYAGYGSYSDPDAFLKYRSALEQSASHASQAAPNAWF